MKQSVWRQLGVIDIIFCDMYVDLKNARCTVEDKPR